MEHGQGRILDILYSLKELNQAKLPPHSKSQFLFKSVPKHLDPLLGLLFFRHKRS